MEIASLCLRTFTLSHHAAPKKLPPYEVEGEDDDFVVICTNRAVLDVGLLSLHDLRADSLIRPIASRSVIQLLSNHCHFNNHIFSAYFFYLARGRGPNYNGNASRLFSLFCI